ncbi:hypothetical protein CpipJ_CPIJ008780 [Culex quinquefasciatus]|uniref:Uncharacterized protein n=1 Tax=Culex quinquefasciatus TaxID=7176 RepID=B0WP01_CULQU|nr:hypothetical protein CpipJ_CPIJ008780 [Culex quinquefasciatus]|eukprot:XP_001850435.1 hypothetical protein CpipJ_CPIJ008780 [Culex quinquefasciatus]
MDHLKECPHRQRACRKDLRRWSDPRAMTAIYRRTRETRQGEAGESMLDGSRMRREARGGGGKFPNRSG